RRRRSRSAYTDPTIFLRGMQYHPVEFELHQPLEYLVIRHVALQREPVCSDRVMPEPAPQRVGHLRLRWCLGQRTAQRQTQGLQYIVNGFHQYGTVAQQAMAAPGPGV